jgi:hypothetical protein
MQAVSMFGRHAAGLRQTVGIGRGDQDIVGPVLIGIGGAYHSSRPVADGNRQPGRGEFLPELRRGRIKFAAQIIKNEPLDVPGNRGLGKEEEIRRRVGAVAENYLLPVAAVQHLAGQGRRDSWEQGQLRRHGVLLPHALGRQQEQARGIAVAEIDVFVLGPDDLVARGRNDLDHILAGGNGADLLFCNRVDDRIKGVAAVKDRRPHLVPVAHAVIAVQRFAAEDKRIIQQAAGIAAGRAAGGQGIVPAVGGCRIQQGRPGGVIQVDGDPGDARLPWFGSAQLRIVFGPGDRVEDDAGNAAVLTGQVFLLAPFDDAGLAEEALEALGQDRTALGPKFGGGQHGGQGRDPLVLGTQLTLPGPGVRWVDGAAVIDGDRQAGGLEAGEIDLGDQPGKEGKDLVKGDKSLAIGGHGLVHRAVPPADVDGLLGNARLAVIAEPVFIIIVEHPVLQAGKPVEDRNLAEGNVGRFDGEVMKSENKVQVVVPHHQLVVAGRHIGNGKCPVFIDPGGVHTPPNPGGPLVQADPGPGVGKRRALMECGLRRPG